MNNFKTIKEGNITENLVTPVILGADVAVAGGGVAGIAAALSAAGAGAKVVLIERGFMLGGLATAGLVTIYLPLCDGCGRQVSFSLAEELLRLSVSEFCDGKGGYVNWLTDDTTHRSEKDPRFEVNFNPQLFAITAEKLLEKEGVQILYGCYAVGASVESGRITALSVEGKSGRFAVRAKSYVDCTGDADINKFAGEDTALFGQGNVLAAWYYGASKTKGYELFPLGVCDVPDEEKEKGTKGEKPLVAQRFSGLDDVEISRMVSLSHDVVLSDFRKRNAADAAFEPATIPTIPQIRMTRRVDGAYVMGADEMHREFADSVGMVSDWRKRGPVYEVPFSTLHGKKIRNLLTAGRCTSVTDGLWDVMRVIPCCAVTGEAAGLAAAITDDITAFGVEALQSELVKRGVKLHESELSR